MVTKKNIPGDQSTVKVRIIDFELSGSDDSLRESLQTIAAAFNGGSQRVQVTRQSSGRTAQLGNAQTQPGDDPDLQEEDETTETDIQDVQSRPASTRKPAASRKPPPVKVLSGISFTDVEPPLKAFFEAKNGAKNATAAYLVVAYWYKHHRGIEDLTPDHFHTAFRQVGFPTPRNIMTTIGELRRSSDGRLMAGAAPGTTAIHHLGENHVDALGKAD